MKLLFPSPVAAINHVIKTDAALAGMFSTDTKKPHVRLSRVGGFLIDYVTEESEVLVEVYHTSTAKAEEAARRLSAVLLSYSGIAIDGAHIIKITQSSGLVDYYNDTLKMDRTQFVVAVRSRAALMD